MHGCPQACETDRDTGNIVSMKILIIEDDLEAAAYLSKAFRETGIVADRAATAREACSWPAKTVTTS